MLLLFPFNIYLSWQTADSSFCRTALLGFAILLRCYYVRGKEPKQLGKQLLSNYNLHHSWLGLTEQQNLTLFRGRAWMSEVERPKFRKDAKPTERSFKGKGGGDF